MVLKQCPKCDQLVPVACKSCPCGHVYFSARKLVKSGGDHRVNSSEETNEECGAVKAVKRRRLDQRIRRQGSLRTGSVSGGDRMVPSKANLLRNRRRVQRGPRQHRQSSSSMNLESANDRQDGDGGEATSNNNNGNRGRKRGRRRKRNPSSEDKDGGGSEKEELDLFGAVPPEKALRYSVILAEINRKIGFSQLQ